MTLPDLDRLQNIDKLVSHFKLSMLGGTPAEGITYLTFSPMKQTSEAYCTVFCKKKKAGQLKSGLQRSNGQLHDQAQYVLLCFRLDIKPSG